MGRKRKHEDIAESIKSSLPSIDSLPYIIMIKDFSKLLNISEETARYFFKSGCFPVFRLGSKYVTTVPKILKWLKIDAEYELPFQQRLLITAAEVASVLRVCEMQGYKIMNQPGFPSLYIGARHMTQVSRFYEWIERQFEEDKQ